MRFQANTILWFLLKLPLVALAPENRTRITPQNDSENMVLLKVPLQSMRYPRQQQETTTPQSTNQTSNPNSTVTRWPQPNPGTAINVGNILTGLFTEDVRPILTGSTAFIPPGNLRETAEAILYGLAPVIQNILFGPNPNTQFQTIYALPHISNNQNQAGQSQATIQNTETPMNSAKEHPVATSTTSPRPPQAVTTKSTLAINSNTQLKGETESGTGGKNKEYIYLVLKPDEYEELVKFESLGKNKTLAEQDPKPQDFREMSSTARPVRTPSLPENEDDEYEAFVLNNVTDLHIRDFYFNGTRVQKLQN